MRYGNGGELKLTDWSFLPDNTWSADVNLEGTSLDRLATAFWLVLSGARNIDGTISRAWHAQRPAITGLFDLAEGSLRVVFNRLRGQLNASPDEVRIANAELRFFAPEQRTGRGAGIVTGTCGIQFAENAIYGGSGGCVSTAGKF